MSVAQPEALEARPERLRSRERRLWWVTFLLLAVAGLCWTFATPLMAGPDEGSHVTRAAAAARGQFTGVSPADMPPAWVEVQIPKGLAGTSELGLCSIGPVIEGSPQYNPTLGASDCPALDRKAGQASAVTNQYRAQPTYYLLVGWLTHPFPDATGVYLMRAATALLVAALIAGAFVSTLRLGWSRLAAAGVFSAVTPMTLYLGGVVSQAGIEIAAAIGVWAGGLALVRGRGEPDRRLVTRVGVALVFLTLIRGFSPIFAVGMVVALTILGYRDRARLAALARRRDVRCWGLAAFAALVASGAWLWYIMKAFPLPDRAGAGFAQSLGRTGWFLRQAVGVFGASDSGLSLTVTLLWFGAALVLFGLGAAWAHRGDIAVAVGVLVAALVLNLTADGASFPPTGYFWQGRYVLPFLVGGFVLAAGVAPAPGRAQARSRAAMGRVIGAALAVLWAIQVWAFAVAFRHNAARPGAKETFGASLSMTDAFLHGNWRPPLLPAPAYLVIFAAALGCLAWCCRALRPAHREAVVPQYTATEAPRTMFDRSLP